MKRIVSRIRIALPFSDICIIRRTFICLKLGALVAVCIVPDLQLRGCRFESHPAGLLRTKVYSAFYPPGSVNEYQLRLAGKVKAWMAHSDCVWTCGCAGKTAKSLENTCHTRALCDGDSLHYTKRRYIKCMDLNLNFNLNLKAE